MKKLRLFHGPREHLEEQHLKCPNSVWDSKNERRLYHEGRSLTGQGFSCPWRRRFRDPLNQVQALPPHLPVNAEHQT
jgi:hypothetical protein